MEFNLSFFEFPDDNYQADDSEQLTCVAATNSLWHLGVSAGLSLAEEGSRSRN
jgi:hypothetical protein